MSITCSVENPSVVDVLPTVVSQQARNQTSYNRTTNVTNRSQLDRLFDRYEAASEKSAKLEAKLSTLDGQAAMACKVQIFTYPVGFETHFEFGVLGKSDIDDLYERQAKQISSVLGFSERAKTVALEELANLKTQAMENYQNVLEMEKAIYDRLGVDQLESAANEAMNERDKAIKDFLSFPCDSVNDLERKLRFLREQGDDLKLFDDVDAYELVLNSVKPKKAEIARA